MHTSKNRLLDKINLTDSPSFIWRNEVNGIRPPLWFKGRVAPNVPFPTILQFHYKKILKFIKQKNKNYIKIDKKQGHCKEDHPLVK